MMVDIAHVSTFKEPMTLTILKQTPGLEKMQVVQRGSRLSVQPVTPEEWEIIIRLGKVEEKQRTASRRKR
jgi:predicted RNA-binding protein with PUA-like domain